MLNWQIKEEAFVEDINMILNSADIPNLYASDEKGEIMDKIQGVAKAEQVCWSDGLIRLIYLLGYWLFEGLPLPVGWVGQWFTGYLLYIDEFR